METTLQWIGVITGVISILGVAFLVYKHFSDPDIEARQEIAKIQLACTMKHKNIDMDISLIKNNHLKHIEEDIKAINLKQMEIITILNERLPNKQ